MASYKKRKLNVRDSSYCSGDSDHENSGNNSTEVITEYGNNKANNRFRKLDGRKRKCHSSCSSVETHKDTNSYYDQELYTTRRPKCFSKNALMARENRMKKKMYIESLEDDVRRFQNEVEQQRKTVQNQTTTIKDLRDEIQYLKNVLANSKELGLLLKTVHNRTGLDVTTSLPNRTANYKRNLPIARKTAHPWDEPDVCVAESSGNSPNHESNPCDINLFPDFNYEHNLVDFPVNICPVDELFPPLPNSTAEIINDVPHAVTDHNYSSLYLNKHENVGVCFHVSKEKISLEFCSKCNTNAADAWMTNQDDFNILK